MKILIFLHGTLIMHSSGRGKTRSQRVKQSMACDSSVLDYGKYIPIGKCLNAINSLREEYTSEKTA